MNAWCWSRRVGETIMIGEDIAGTVLSVKGNQVRIGIAAPANVSIHREEIYECIQHEQASTAAQRATG